MAKVIDRATARDPSARFPTALALADAIEAVVIREDEQTGTLLLGGKAGRRFHGGEEREEAFRHRLPVEGQVTAVTKGGVEVQIARLLLHHQPGPLPDDHHRAGARCRGARPSAPAAPPPSGPAAPWAPARG